MLLQAPLTELITSHLWYFYTQIIFGCRGASRVPEELLLPRLWEALRAPAKRFPPGNSFQQLRSSPQCWNQSSGGSGQINTSQDFIHVQRSCQTPKLVLEAPLCQAPGGAEPSGASWARSWAQEAPQLETGMRMSVDGAEEASSNFQHG